MPKNTPTATATREAEQAAAFVEQFKEFASNAHAEELCTFSFAQTLLYLFDVRRDLPIPESFHRYYFNDRDGRITEFYHSILYGPLTLRDDDPWTAAQTAIREWIISERIMEGAQHIARHRQYNLDIEALAELIRKYPREASYYLSKFE